MRAGDRMEELRPPGSATHEFGCHGCAPSKRRRQIPFRKVAFAAVGAHMAGKLGHTPVWGGPTGQKFSAVQVAASEALTES